MKARQVTVSIPYGLTLLSNGVSNVNDYISVSIPYGLTLLSNILAAGKLHF